MKSIYIVVSQTGTILSRIIKFLKKREYNHVSIGMDRRLRYMFSYGRLNPYNTFIGGFVHESPYHGTFKRFKNTKAIVYEVKVTDEVYRDMVSYLCEMKRHPEIYRYNYMGLYLGAINVHYQPENHFYCSEFVRHMLVRYGLAERSEFKDIVEPSDFMDVIPEKKIVFQGLLSDYRTKYEASIRKACQKLR